MLVAGAVVVATSVSNLSFLLPYSKNHKSKITTLKSSEMNNCGDFNDQQRRSGALMYPRTSTVERREGINDARRLLSLWADQNIGNDSHSPSRSSPSVRGSRSRGEFLCSVLDEALDVNRRLQAQLEILNGNTPEDSSSSTTSEKEKSDEKTTRQ
jgi:hypothetical protein